VSTKPNARALTSVNHFRSTAISRRLRSRDGVRARAKGRPQRNGRCWRILLKKSFGSSEQKVLGLLMHFVRSDVRVHIALQKTDHRPSYRRYGTSQQRYCPKISICEIFGVVRFSTFSTISAQSGHTSKTPMPALPRLDPAVWSGPTCVVRTTLCVGPLPPS
jgi:hypothetical protein